jgi:hypothetical protein
MSANRTVTATFTPVSGGPFTLATSVTGQGSITRSPNATSYPAGTVVTLTANAASGWRFDSWSGNLAGSANPTTITMSANRSVVANFVQVSREPGLQPLRVRGHRHRHHRRCGRTHGGRQHPRPAPEPPAARPVR